MVRHISQALCDAACQCSGRNNAAAHFGFLFFLVWSENMLIILFFTSKNKSAQATTGGTAAAG